ncbi:caspase family protein [Bradyrhizobium sp. WYCCWR 12699]|uniref:caspase family protein n=1 Tax=Bradyrhizobium sp. WYCCWR 12699 TaxID=3064203 RepID=UPI0028A52F75|nr:caspase family protein [Bradyrhizobium sp. WYCCWR 12699]MDT4740272.1 caspase family protein [Bradyrhizobium sp. WYCCWR 12699]
MVLVRLFYSFLFIFVGLSCAQAQHRVALVLGNSAYKSVPRLTNPVNDASLVGDMFKKAGFKFVDIRTDLNAMEMRKALRDFGARAREAEVAVIYYAGHGIELDGINYLIPTDASLETDSDVLDEAVALDRALFAVEPAKQLRLVILDACRDNPFAKSMKRTVAARAIGRGLAKVEPTSPNTMIAFAAKAGSTASDGDFKNSPFATAIVERLPTPGLDLRKAFGFVRDDVLKNTGFKQEPYVYGSLGGEDIALVPTKPSSTLQQANPQDVVRRDYELALQVGTRAVWTAFLAQYPYGFYASLAQGQLDRIAAEETRVTAAETARLAEQEKFRLAADRAKKSEQENAAAAAKAAEDARIVAEKSKQIAEAKAAVAEQQRKEAEAAAEKTAAKAEAVPKDKQIGSGTEQNVAALAPATNEPAHTPKEINKLVLTELRRVGCITAPSDDDWNGAAHRAVSKFNKLAGTKFEVRSASIDLLDAIKAKQERVCPLVCESGFEPIDDRCVKRTCDDGQTLNERGSCVPKDRNGTPTRKQDRPLASRQEAAPANSAERRSPSGGRCVSISQRCALEIGGRCDPSTGKWEYGRNGAGGSTQSFNACLGRMMAGRR